MTAVARPLYYNVFPCLPFTLVTVTVTLIVIVTVTVTVTPQLLLPLST